MKQRLQGLITGIAIGAICTGGVAYAKSVTQTIEVTYDNIKVYKDNVLCELKDGNGSVIEPFIYNGTTYMPVRGTANLAGMEVTWEGASKSVYLWDTLVPNGTYLMEVCPPYEKSGYYQEYLQQKGNSFSMAGQKYSNGFVLGSQASVFVNLNSKYSYIDFETARLDGDYMNDQTVSFFIDGKLVKEIEVGAEDLPQSISIPVSYGLQLKIVTGEGYTKTGFGNITVR